MKKILLLFLIAFFCDLKAQNQWVKGKVVNSENIGVSDAEVHLIGLNRKTKTNALGGFRLSVSDTGIYTLVVWKDGYERMAQEIHLYTGDSISLNIVIQRTTEFQKVGISGIQQRDLDKPSSGLRLNTSILKMPQNIQVVSSQVLAEQQVYDMLEGVQRNVSGAQRLEHWDNYSRINMRGSQITPFRNGMNMHLSPWSPLTEDMSFVDRIEFVKGPAGFMLASGEPGGFYNIVTKKPTGVQKGEVTMALGSFNLMRSTIDLDGKLSKDGKWLYRFNMMGQLKNTHRDYEFNNRYSIAPVIKCNIDDKSSFTLEYNEQYSQMSTIGGNYAFSRKGYADLPVNFSTLEPNLQPVTINERTVYAMFEHKISADWKLNAQASYMHFKQIGQSLWPWGISQYNDSFMQRGVSIWDALGFNKSAQVFVNGKLKTGKVIHKIMGGLDMSHKDYYADWNQGAALGDSFNIYDPAYGKIGAANIPQWDRTKDIRERAVRYNNSYSGLYLQDELGFFEDKLRLTVAGRYTHINYINPYSGTSDDARFTPRFGLSWSVQPKTSVYAVYDKIFLANAGSDWQGKNFDPVTGTNMELGFKKEWFDQWSSTLSVYKIVKSNVLTTDLDHPDPVTGQFIYSRTNGEQQIQGLELDVRGELFKNCQIVLNYAYTDGKVTKDANPAVVGNRVAGVTTHIQNTWISYRLRCQLEGLKISLGNQFQGKRSSWFIWDNSQNALPDYMRWDGNIAYKKGKFGINVQVNNLLNKYLYTGAPYSGMYYWQTEPLRNYRVGVNYNF